MKRNKKFVKKDARNWFTWSSYRKLQTTPTTQLCGAAWSSRWLRVQLTNGQHTCELVFKPEVDVLNIVVTINLFSLYLMNFTLHTMLDAAGVVLRVHYKVWNVMFYFHKVAYVQYLGEVGIFHTWVKKFIPLYNSAKITKIDRYFPKLWSQLYCHLFYGSPYSCHCLRERRQVLLQLPRPPICFSRLAGSTHCTDIVQFGRAWGPC